MPKIHQKDSPLNALIGLTITNVICLHGYVQLHFTNQIGLSIYNDITIKPTSISIGDFRSKVVQSISECASEIEINCFDGAKVLIDMRPDAYRGPEALQLNRPGFPPMIWN